MPLDDVNANVNALIAHQQRKTRPKAAAPATASTQATPAAMAATATPVDATMDAPPLAPQDIAVREDARRAIHISQRTLWTVALTLLALSAILFANSRRLTAPAEARLPDGLKVESVVEHLGEHGWSVDGIVSNGPSNVRRTVVGFAYTDASGNVISQVVIDLEDLNAGERREFSVLIPGYGPGLTRTMVALETLDYND